MRTTIWFVAVLASAGCLRSTEYRCTDSTQCSGGTCESVGYCSFADSACAGGQRFSESAGTYAGQCVDGQGVDGGVDAPVDDAPIDTPSLGCPANYMTVGSLPHRYRVVTNQANFAAQKAACAADGPNVYVAIPDDAAEAAAIAGLFMISNSIYVGIEDPTEGTYVNVKGQPQTYLPWEPGQPNNNNEQDCVEMNRQGGQQINDVSCNEQLRTACECEP